MTRLAYVMSMSFVVLAIVGRPFVPITPKLIWNASASAPIGLYTVRTAADLDVTDLVAVDAPEPLASFLGEGEYLPRGVPLMKRIAALPGQTVCRIGRNVSVDTIAMGEALVRDRRGRELPVWQGCRTLGARRHAEPFPNIQQKRTSPWHRSVHLSGPRQASVDASARSCSMRN